MTNKFKKRARALSKKTGMKYEAAHRASQKPDTTARQEAAFDRYWEMESKEPPLKDAVAPGVKRQLVMSYMTSPEGRIRLVEAMRSPIRLRADFVRPMIEENRNRLNSAVGVTPDWPVLRGYFDKFTALFDCIFTFATDDAERAVLEAATEEERAIIAKVQADMRWSPRDENPLPTDWTDYNALLDDMRRFAKENRDYLFLCADDPGANHNPPRISRFGFEAFLPVPRGEDEKRKVWTITIGAARETATSTIGQAAERRAMLERLVIAAREYGPLNYTNEQSLASSLNGHVGLGWPINEHVSLDDAIWRIEMHRKIGRIVLTADHGGMKAWSTFYTYGDRQPDNWGPEDEKCVFIQASLSG